MAMKVIGVNPSKFHRSQIKFYIILAPIILFMMLPILYIVMHALKPIDELYLYPPRFFVQNPTLDNFARLFNQTGLSQIPVSRFLFNNIVIAISTVLATIYVSVSAGYALSKIRFRGRSTIFTINQLALMFVAVAVQIPRYLVITKIGLADNFLVHILPELAMPVGLFLVKQNIDQIPDSLIEAAEIDGATQFYVLRRVIVPLVKPALATVAILSFQAAWNQRGGVEHLYQQRKHQELRVLYDPDFQYRKRVGRPGNGGRSRAADVPAQPDSFHRDAVQGHGYHDECRN